jgi:peptidyl-prolyl cis-trans isomerase D
MLETLRKGATSKVAAIVIFVPLILAFALWGIAPEMRNAGSSTLARVGKTEITPDQFQQAYQIELQNLSAQFGRRITPDQGRAFGLDQRVISRLVGAAALDQQAKELGLTVSDKDIIETIRLDPNYAGLDGRFSRDAFNQFLRGSGLSEQAYMNLRRRDDVREQVVSMLADGAGVPASMIATLHAHRSETRTLEFFTMDADKVVKVAEPDEAALKTFYEANKRSFMTPAYRKLNLMTLSREQVKSKLDVTDADVKAAYEQTKETFNTPETRKLQQVSFPDKAAAEKAFETLSKAANFVEAAGKLGFKESDLDIGTVIKSQLIDKKIAEAAFALKAGELSKPIEGQFTTALVRAVEIKAGVTKTFEDVKALVKDKLATERAGRELATLHDKAEDERAAGRTLKEVADKIGLPFQVIEAVDQNGKGVDGTAVAGVPDVAKVLAAAFGATQGVEADAVELSDGGYAWFDVLGVTPEKERPFDAAKADAKTRWLEVEKAKALGEASAKFVERVLKGEALDAVATAAGGKLEKSPAVLRTTSPQGLTNDAVRQAFALPKGAASSSATADGKTRTIFRVSDVTPATAATKEQAERIKAEVQRSMQGDALNAYVGALQTRYGVTINQQVFNQTLGLDRATR